MAKRWFSANANASAISIFGDIGSGGVTVADFHRELGEFKSAKRLSININSDGGDVPAGFAIFNMLENHPAHKVVRIQGLAASMASVIAMAGDEIEMPSNAMMMIHNPWGTISGGSDQIASFADALDKMQTNIAAAYVKRTGLAEEAVREMMDAETWLTAEEAVEKGFATRVVDPIQMAASFDLSRFKHPPEAFGAKSNVIDLDKRRAAAPRKTLEEIRGEFSAMQESVFRKFNNPPRGRD